MDRLFIFQRNNSQDSAFELFNLPPEPKAIMFLGFDS